MICGLDQVIIVGLESKRSWLKRFSVCWRAPRTTVGHVSFRSRQEIAFVRYSKRSARVIADQHLLCPFGCFILFCCFRFDSGWPWLGFDKYSNCPRQAPGLFLLSPTSASLGLYNDLELDILTTFFSCRYARPLLWCVLACEACPPPRGFLSTLENRNRSTEKSFRIPSSACSLVK